MFSDVSQFGQLHVSVPHQLDTGDIYASCVRASSWVDESVDFDEECCCCYCEGVGTTSVRDIPFTFVHARSLRINLPLSSSSTDHTTDSPPTPPINPQPTTNPTSTTKSPSASGPTSPPKNGSAQPRNQPTASPSKNATSPPLAPPSSTKNQCSLSTTPHLLSRL